MERLPDNNLLLDEFQRNATYTKPRTVELDTKYEGAVRIHVWTGYAVLVVDGQEKRKVITGPAVYHLNYDEVLEQITLSTGKPKTTDRLHEDVYLRVLTNKIGDIIKAETKDMVEVHIKVSYRIDFVGDSNKWFDVKNYVKFLCDHCRSLIRNAVKQVNIQELHDDYINQVRNAILCQKKEDLPKEITDQNRGRYFQENGMLIRGVEVLGKISTTKRLK